MQPTRRPHQPLGFASIWPSCFEKKFVSGQYFYVVIVIVIPNIVSLRQDHVDVVYRAVLRCQAQNLTPTFDVNQFE